MCIVRRLGRIGTVEAATRRGRRIVSVASVLALISLVVTRLHVTLDHPTDLPSLLAAVMARRRPKSKLTLVVHGEALAGQLMGGDELLDDVDVTGAAEDASGLRGEDKLVQVLAAALRPGGLPGPQRRRHHKVVLVAGVAVLGAVVLHAQAVAHLVAGDEDRLKKKKKKKKKWKG